MRLPLAVAAALALAGCTSSTTTPGDDDVTPDAGPPACDPSAAFGAPALVGGLDGAEVEGHVALSADERTAYFSRGATGEDLDLFEATRGGATGAFGAATALTSLNQGSADEGAPSVTADGLVMVFSSDRGGTFDLFVADRDVASEPFFVRSQISSVNSGFADTDGFVSADGGELWFSSDRDGDFDLYRAAASATSFDGEAPVTELNTAGPETSPVLTDDGLTIYFARDDQIFTATRSSPTGTFTGVTQLTALGAGQPQWLSAGGCRLYFASTRGGGDHDIYVAEKP